MNSIDFDSFSDLLGAIKSVLLPKPGEMAVSCNSVNDFFQRYVEKRKIRDKALENPLSPLHGQAKSMVNKQIEKLEFQINDFANENESALASIVLRKEDMRDFDQDQILLVRMACSKLSAQKVSWPQETAVGSPTPEDSQISDEESDFVFVSAKTVVERNSSADLNQGIRDEDL